LGLDVPDDVSVVGYDNVPQAAWKGYDLTTVSQPAEAMIEATLAILIEQIESQSVERRASILPSQLIVRGTSRLPG